MSRLVYFIWAFVLITQTSLGQVFEYKAYIDTVPTNQFYKILLTPDILSRLNDNFSDIRLYDEQDNEVPYVLKKEQAIQYKTLFKEYKIINKSSSEKATILILQNPGKNKINNISLHIKNASVSKKVKLSGSSDAKSWYSIEDNYLLQSVYNNSSTSEVRMLDFPLSDYEYYKLELNDSLSAPLNIIRAGYYDTHTENGKYTAISQVTFRQKESRMNKQTLIEIMLDQPTFIDKLEVEVASPALYLRKATIYATLQEKGRKRRRKSTYKPVSFAELKSGADNTIFLSDFRSKNFHLIIDNEDNTPLQIKNIRPYQLNVYLIAELRKNTPYTLQFGNLSVGPPSYDLQFFTDKIPQQLPLVRVKKITHIPPGQETHKIFTNKNIIWIAISLVIAMLGYLSYQMLKVSGKQKM